MVTYDLAHLTQPDDQRVLGPIQDDEALFLFALVKGMRLRRILEIGGLDGYSSTNFLAASAGHDGVVYTVDINPVPQKAPNHRVILKNALHLTPEDLDNRPVDMVFFDCHDTVQMKVFRSLKDNGIITDDTVLALHDTNLHFAPWNVWGRYIEEEDGYAHQPVERQMVNEFKDLGYDVFAVRTTKDKHDETLPFRHGITLCQKFQRNIS